VSRPVLARTIQVAAVALTRGFTVEVKPTDFRGAVLRMRKGGHSGSVSVDCGGELVGWRTGGRPALEQLKATLNRLQAVRP
jgi:hypothetical protein